MVFKEEFKKNIKYGFFAIGIVFLFMGGYYFNAVNSEFDVICSSCVTPDCQDNNLICGDFGVYYFKFAILIGMAGMGVMVILRNQFNIEVEDE